MGRRHWNPEMLHLSAVNSGKGGKCKMLRELITSTRSYRRFHEDYVIRPDTLRKLVDFAWLGASAANIQSLRHILSCDRGKCSHFLSSGMDRLSKDWCGPPDGERPSAYIIILYNSETTLSFGCDYGIAAQNIVLGATKKNLGGYHHIIGWLLITYYNYCRKSVHLERRRDGRNV